MNTAHHRAGAAVRALRFAHAAVGAEDKIPICQPGGIRWRYVAEKFYLYTRLNMQGAVS